MKTPALFAFGMMIFSLASWNRGAHAASADAARAAIAAQAARFTAALSEGQAAAAAAYFTDDARLSLPGMSGVLEGRSAVEQFWQAVLGNGMKSLALATRDLEGQGDLRVETGRYSAFGADQQQLGSGEYLIVWKRVGGEWKIHRDYAHPADGGAPPAAKTSSMPASAIAQLPRNYAKTLLRVGDTSFNESTGKLSTVYANELAASTQGFSQERYPDGSLVLMEFAEPQRDGEGQPLRDARGVPLPAKVERIDVMRRIAGFGAVYGEDRAGEWAFASYRPDGGLMLAPEQGKSCAACHKKAGAEKDFVFRARRWTKD